MVDIDKPIDDIKVECVTCLKEIPKSGAKSVETSDYVHYFCGLECYEKWQQKKQNEDK